MLLSPQILTLQNRNWKNIRNWNITSLPLIVWTFTWFKYISLVKLKSSCVSKATPKPPVIYSRGVFWDWLWKYPILCVVIFLLLLTVMFCHYIFGGWPTIWTFGFQFHCCTWHGMAEIFMFVCTNCVHLFVCILI